VHVCTAADAEVLPVVVVAVVRGVVVVMIVMVVVIKVDVLMVCLCLRAHVYRGGGRGGGMCVDMARCSGDGETSRTACDL